VKDLDVCIHLKHPDHERAGLRMSSVIRVAHLSTLPDNAIQGAIGDVSADTPALIKERLRRWLS